MSQQHPQSPPMNDPKNEHEVARQQCAHAGIPSHQLDRVCAMRKPLEAHGINWGNLLQALGKAEPVILDVLEKLLAGSAGTLATPKQPTT